MPEITVPELIKLLESFPLPEDKTQRTQLREAIRNFDTKIKDENVFQHEILSSPLRLVIPRVASDLHIPEILLRSERPVSTDDLVKETEADPLLLARILRYLASQHLISSPSPHVWTSSTLTPYLANPAFVAGLRFGTTCVLPSALATPDLLASASFKKDLSKLETTAFQKGNSTTDSMYQWFAKHPAHQKDFQTWMAETQKRQESLFGILPLDQFFGSEIEASSTETTTIPEPKRLFVDVGGGNSRLCAEVRERYPYPAFKGQVINQDIQASLVGPESGLTNNSNAGIEHQDYDFFTEQPAKGARVYHLRNILHNWSDDECVKILSNTREAMDDDGHSVAIVDSTAISDSELSWYDSYVDLVMGMFFGARVRSLDEYKALAEKAGLVWEKTLKYGEESNQYVAVLRKKKLS